MNPSESEAKAIRLALLNVLYAFIAYNVWGLIFRGGRGVFTEPLWGSLSIIAILLIVMLPGSFIGQPALTCWFTFKLAIGIGILSLIVCAITPAERTEKFFKERIDPVKQEDLTCSCIWAININYKDHTTIDTHTIYYTGVYKDAVRQQESAVALWNQQNPKTPTISSTLNVYYMTPENAKENRWANEIANHL